MSTTDPREREPAGAADDERRAPFLFGAQYYRAPTPEPALWRDDLRAMRALGFNAVKYFLQWRWSHRAPDRYHFDDLDRLMNLAAELGLGVTLNFVLNVSPVWLFDVCPDAKQVDSRGRCVEPYVVGHRQIGGHPGPCYRHPGALEHRKRFLATAVEHFRGHAALQMWDVWNESELSFPQRTPDLATMVWYCPQCERGFRAWLRRKYSTVDRLDEVWGRCYELWEQVELPRGTGAYTDFVDWREFHLDTMAEEAAAWGLVKPDGSPRPVTGAVRRFWDTLRPHVTSLRRAFPPPAKVGVWRSRKNEIFLVEGP